MSRSCPSCSSLAHTGRRGLRASRPREERSANTHHHPPLGLSPAALPQPPAQDRGHSHTLPHHSYIQCPWNSQRRSQGHPCTSCPLPAPTAPCQHSQPAQSTSWVSSPRVPTPRPPTGHTAQLFPHPPAGKDSRQTLNLGSCVSPVRVQVPLRMELCPPHPPRPCLSWEGPSPIALNWGTPCPGLIGSVGASLSWFERVPGTVTSSAHRQPVGNRQSDLPTRQGQEPGAGTFSWGPRKGQATH